MNANQSILDRLTGYAVNLDRFSLGIAKKAKKLLKELEKELLVLLIATDLSWYQKRKLKSLLKESKSLIAATYIDIGAMTNNQLLLLPKVEIKAVTNAINLGIGANIANTSITTEQVRALVSTTIVEGASVKQWWNRQNIDTTSKFADSVRQGLIQGETTSDIVRRVRGTNARNYKDGIMPISRRHAETLILSSAAEVSNKARNEVFKQNEDIIKLKQWVSVLDKRTSEVCRARSGLKWTMDNKPIGHKKRFNGGTPAHMRCRSFINVVVKNFEEEGVEDVFQSEMRKMGFSEAEIKATKMNTQAAMNGQVAKELNYSDWLKAQDIAFQKDVLGAKKWQLWNNGKIEMKDLIDNNGRTLTYQQLYDKYL